MTDKTADAIVHATAAINGLSLHYATLGSGPVVLLCHGFPDLWYSWRRQMTALADAGYRVIAPDMRGFGDSGAPSDPEAYTALHAVGDMVGLLDHLAIERCVIVGHDWGATIAWAAAQFRPDRFIGVVGLAVPFSPRGPASLPAMLRATAPPSFYMLYFLEPGRAERELDANPRTFLRRLFYSNSGSMPLGAEPNMVTGKGGTLTESLAEPTGPIPWLTEEELDVYVAAYERVGFRGALNTYRSLHRTWELTAAWMHAPITVPLLFVCGSRDIVLRFPGMTEAIERLPHTAPKSSPPLIIPGVGHWVHQEAADRVNVALLQFLESVCR